MLIENGVKVVAEAANMPCEQAAVDAFIEAGRVVRSGQGGQCRRRRAFQVWK